ncbi:regulatory protein GemA [Azospirillum picis]|uniref:Phage gp16-like protein n=1 Tax=Azospirillum picis TaxID=488438 RepID=A0ABU0MNR6_9PROT|nr:regulatory protein GemA [Azospirillum picis]MBP2301289.1 phage gp16-like protein [Azospirillum picis]MDQ0535120.1 phage gp16-like protein [Azospirillum picis]
MTSTVKPSDARRSADLKAIHAMRRELSLTEDCYRARVSQVAGGRTDSAADLTARERSTLIEQLKGLGAGKKLRGRPLRPALTPQQRKVRAMWLDLADKGVIGDRSEAALAAWLKSRIGVDALQWLQPADAGRAIEQLKRWTDRVEEVPQP